MQLGTGQECVGSSPRVLGVFKDGIREFTRRRLGFVERLSGVAEKLTGRLTMTRAIELSDDGPRLSLSIRPGLDDGVGPRQEFARRFAEGIGKLTGSAPGDHWKKTG
ncbi:hypothetical protein B296_00010749 [Ensete ventricosum]|uniref:Uncharacterized protein n=1 Tax=Ensete ventricosum TaxID=4639 RepID=A0A427B8T8_ENSVE|nr:hypothetical protein B296_00010749 [Ensete ventricosum]